MICPGKSKANFLKHKAIRPNAFTLIEMLVVIAIIAVLVGITTMVGSAVINTGKKQATLGVIQSLDEALSSYIDAKGDIPPALVEIPYANLPPQIQGDMSGDNSAFYPAIDGRGQENTSADLKIVNSVALFIQSASTVPEVQEHLNAINSKFLINYSADEAVQPFILTAFDAWGNPIRYVHPKFHGIIERERRTLGDAGEPVNIANPNKPFFVQGAMPVGATRRIRMKFVRRNRLIDADYGDDGPSQGGANPGALSDFDLLPDSDGGLTSGSKPYFYSAGPDGDPSTIEDNIYSSTPQLADPGVN
jgi:prepilin-type N-terminal cleavage/methylation domain-containing protein